MRLTQSPLLDLLCCHSKSGEDFHQYLYDNVSDCWCKGDSSVNIKSAEESLDGLEQLDESFIARTNVLYPLVHLKVRRAIGIRVAERLLRRVRLQMQQIPPSQVGMATECASGK